MRRLLIKLLTTILCGPCNERVEMIVMSDTSPDIFHKGVRRSAREVGLLDETTKAFYEFAEKFSIRKGACAYAISVEGYWNTRLLGE